MNFIEEIKQKARNTIKTIVLPESTDIRVLEAARKVTDEGFAKVILLGDVDNLCFGTDSDNENATCQQAYQHFDILVSNPPYVCENEASKMSEIVLNHEPRLALFVPDDDPLVFYRAIGRFGLKHLKPNGLLYFEINAAYGRATCQLLNELGYHNVELRCDVTGRDRMVKASKIVNC